LRTLDMADTDTPASAAMPTRGPRDGTLVVLINAAGLDLTYRDAQIGALSEEHDVVVLGSRHAVISGCCAAMSWPLLSVHQCCGGCNGGLG
jgi:hypothetical protein